LEDGRLIVYSDTVRMIGDHPWGTGLNTYEDVFRRYQTYRPGLLFDHAHNDYLEIIAEWGLLPAAIFWGGIAFVLLKSSRVFIESDSSEVRGILLACIGSILSIMLHSLVDFNLQIPSNALLFYALVGVALATSSMRVDKVLLRDGATYEIAGHR
jgi:O-antigen ligase